MLCRVPEILDLVPRQVNIGKMRVQITRDLIPCELDLVPRQVNIGKMNVQRTRDPRSCTETT